MSGRVRGPLAVRPATSADAVAVADLEDRCLGADAWSAGLVGAAVNGEVPTVSVVIAEEVAEEVAGAADDGALLGYAVVSVVDDVAELQRVAVDRAHRRRGVAGALLDDAERIARAGGAERLLLEVRVDNAAALALYRGRGFDDLGRREHYYRDGAPALVLARPLGRMDP